MKKLLLLCSAFALAASVATAQEKTKTEKTQVVKDETTVKKTATPGQKVHNTFSKKKKYSGTKTKRVRETKKEAETTTK